MMAMARKLPFPIIRSDERSPAVGWLLSSAAWLGIVGFMLLWFAMMAIIPGETESPFLVLIGVFGIFFAFYFTAFPWFVNLAYRGRRMRAPSAVDILSSGEQAPVVLLRSFDDDDLIDPSFSATTQIFPGRYEERLVEGLRRIGPVLALGRPGEREPELGAARLYVENEHWKEAIIYLIQESRAVVAIVGRTKGLWWEIELALSQVPPEKLIFFFPYPAPKKVRKSYFRAMYFENPVIGQWLRRTTSSEMEAEREQRYQSFRERFGSLFKGALPPALDEVRFLQLDSEGRPLVIAPMKPSLLKRIATANFSPRFDIPFSRELRPFVQKFEVPTA